MARVKIEKEVEDELEGGSAAPAYAAPALEKGLDILETLSASNVALSQIEIAERIGRSVSQMYRMLTCLVSRNYVANVGESYSITTKLFELAHNNPPTNHLLSEATPIMQELASEIEQACHLTVFSAGRQVVIAKVDSPSWVGFSIRVGALLDLLVSASGRVLLAFQDPTTRDLRIKEALRHRPQDAEIEIGKILESIQDRGFESMVSMQVKGLHAISFPILDTRNRAMAALTVPYADRLEQSGSKSIADAEVALGRAAKTLSERMGWREGVSNVEILGLGEAGADDTPRRRRRAKLGNVSDTVRQRS
ncbi:IclR family transcriptional regulator (plasmid) [Rhizobium sp. NIBRBAC000502774]|jgi:DNA-binding IclR family transcriptional regulator|uniref:IclR family transcriptional regulator n=1 Tax=Agrobacterium tumefaciens TaxID=358 RepID=UPI0011407CA1|nr:IclR family transcriptional regulator [Agrobacterium tumefaciens]QDG93867.1 IclR family transcriptional regulator [Rhizobium sp. NIBRBAC000502774]NSY46420.1 IclR family transcriptional regulator [Agrobacterium tumefaciens]NSZ76881.1 IclR family transcriptional regulator [Agrobacterium tumefaciens]NSZ87361.1 IclR family transcriptional regulator [Agrobacterium tumefaciens]WCA72742.1 IclR family transcriptional regulator [Agrobacterium tumefaciens]